MAILVVVIESVADDECVGDVEAAIVRFDDRLLAAVLALAEQHADPQRGDAQTAQMLAEMAERLSGVEDVIEKQDMPAAQVGQQLGLDAQRAGTVVSPR